MVKLLRSILKFITLGLLGYFVYQAPDNILFWVAFVVQLLNILLNYISPAKED